MLNLGNKVSKQRIYSSNFGIVRIPQIPDFENAGITII
jgi:hypothetical protein